MTDDFITIGRLGRSHGLQGELKTRIEEDYLDDFLQAKAIFLVQKGLSTPFFIEYMRGKGSPLIKLEGINNRGDASLIQHAEVKMRAADLSEIIQEDSPEEGFTIFISYQLHDIEHGLIGVLAEIIESPQQQLGVVDYQGREVLLPLHEDFISRIDEKNKVLYLDLPEGILHL